MIPDDAKDGIWVDDQYYILATSARASRRSAVLKYGDTFSVFDAYGDIVASRAGEPASSTTARAISPCSRFDSEWNGRCCSARARAPTTACSAPT